MKRITILFLGFMLVSLSTSFAQGYMDYVDKVSGDTLVVKDYYDMGNQPNSINNVIAADSQNVPAGRVYQLKTAGWYPQSAGLTTPARPIVIAGADNTPLVKGVAAPPIISGYYDESGAHVGGITWSANLTVKNLSTVIGSPDGTGGWAFYGSGATGSTVVFDNVMMEHNWWVFIQSNGNAGTRLYFKNDYFVNMSGRPCRRNGGVYDNVNNPTDTVSIENCTHVMAQGMMYKFRNYEVGLIFANHNTFVNCAGTIFETQGFQSNVVVTNNIFVNSNLQPFRPNMTEDLSEQDAGGLPTGIIDVMDLPSTMNQLPRKFLVQNNVAYWDPKVANLAADANSQAINTFTTWVNQSVTMNSRTQAMFNDNAKYPYLVEGNWINKLPAFKNSANLFTDQLDALKTFALATVDTTSPAILADWRVTSTGDNTFIYSDWPIPVDLSYTDDIKGTDNLPVGDLNWFPTAKANYVANRATYYNAIMTALNAGTLVSVKEVNGVVRNYKLEQNYPNPFNPTTNINFSLQKAGFVTLKVYNAIGQEVATLLNGFKPANNYSVEFNASNLPSGVYFYKLTADNFEQTMKMILMK